MLQFQGGFAAKSLAICYFVDQQPIQKENHSLQDTSGQQRISLSQAPDCDQVKLELSDCSDMFGRLIVYSLAID